MSNNFTFNESVPSESTLNLSGYVQRKENTFSVLVLVLEMGHLDTEK